MALVQLGSLKTLDISIFFQRSSFRGIEVNVGIAWTILFLQATHVVFVHVGFCSQSEVMLGNDAVGAKQSDSVFFHSFEGSLCQWVNQIIDLEAIVCWDFLQFLFGI